MTQDPFYEMMRSFLRGNATWEEVEKADDESLEALRQRRAVRQLVESGLSNPETSSQVLDWILSKPQTTPNV